MRKLNIREKMRAELSDNACTQAEWNSRFNFQHHFLQVKVKKASKEGEGKKIIKKEFSGEKF